MKIKFFSIALCAALALLFCSCSTFEPTKSVDEALAHIEDSIEYHNREYMSRRGVGTGMNVPDVKKLGQLNFIIGLDEQGNTGGEHGLNSNVIKGDAFKAFQRELENAVAGSKRFSIAQMTHGLNDKNLRKSTHNGTTNIAEFDPSELKKIEGIIHTIPMLSNASASNGNQRTTTYTFKLVCNPLYAKNNAPIPEFPPFSVQFSADIKNLTDKFGRTKVGLRFDDLRGGRRSSRLFEDFQLRQGRAAIVKLFATLYKNFPVGGVVTNFDEDGRALFKANRAIGLQKNMECVIFGVKKGDPDAIPVPLFNATVDVLSQTGNSTLQIWRESEKNSAKKIIAKIKADFDEAKEEYDFYACSDGFAEWPDFIERSTKKGDE